MTRRSRSLQVLAVAAGLLLALASPASGQPRVIENVIPFPVPYFAGAAGTVIFGDQVIDVANLLPQYVQRPLDDLSTRPGAEAMGMGGAHLALAEGPMAMGWNPAGLGLMTESAIAVDGFLKSSSNTASGYPDTVEVEGQPVFMVNEYEDRLGSTQNFGFLGGAFPILQIGRNPLVAGIAHRRHTEVSYGEEIVMELGILETTSFPFVYGSDNRERGSIESTTLSLAYKALDIPNLWVSIGGNANFLRGRLRSEVEIRVNVRGFDPGYLSYKRDYKGFSGELGLQAGIAEKVRVGGWISLPYDLEVYNSDFVSQSIADPNSGFVVRTRGDIASFDMQIPLFASAGIAVGPYYGIELAGDINYRPWSKTHIRHTDDAYGIFDGAYPAADITAYSLGARFEFPVLRSTLNNAGMILNMMLGYSYLPLSMYSLDLVGGADPYYYGDQVESEAYSLGFSLRTSAKISFEAGLEFQTYDYRNWFLNSPNAENTGFNFDDRYEQAVLVNRNLTVLRFSSTFEL